MTVMRFFKPDLSWIGDGRWSFVRQDTRYWHRREGGREGQPTWDKGWQAIVKSTRTMLRLVRTQAERSNIGAVDDVTTAALRRSFTSRLRVLLVMAIATAPGRPAAAWPARAPAQTRRW